MRRVLALKRLRGERKVEAARVLAERSSRHSADCDQRLIFAFRRVVCRAPTISDLARLRRAYDRQLAIYQNEPANAESLLKVGASPRDESLNPSEQAALTAVCLAILNFDEALTRE